MTFRIRARLLRASVFAVAVAGMAGTMGHVAPKLAPPVVHAFNQCGVSVYWVDGDRIAIAGLYYGLTPGGRVCQLVEKSERVIIRSLIAI